MPEVERALSVGKKLVQDRGGARVDKEKIKKRDGKRTIEKRRRLGTNKCPRWGGEEL